MKQYLTRSIMFLLFVLVSLAIVSSAVAADTTVVANTKDWQSLYLISVYADFIGADFVFIKSLSDAELKTSLLGDDQLIIFESLETPVIKNYQSFLSINGFTSVGEYEFYDVFDLQEYLYDQVKPRGIIVLGNDFGMEAVAAVPYALKKNYFPVFYDESNFRFLYRSSRRGDVVALGRVPYRVVERLRPDKIFIDDPYTSTLAITRLAVSELDSAWGVITRIDQIDYDTVRKDIPVFVYFGEDYIDGMADIIRESGISNYEVISGDTADIAKEFESQSQRDLNLMLKFGRKITNYKGLENSILDVDTVKLPFPSESLTLVDVAYQPDMELFTITYRNEGNIAVYAFSNVDYAGTVISDEHAHPILPGETKTISYDFPGATLTELADPAVITTRYGFAIPLKKVVQGPTGLPFVERNVTQSTFVEEAPPLNFKSVSFDGTTGELSLAYANAGSEPVEFFTELFFEDKIFTSETDVVQPGEVGHVSIDFAYVPNNRLVGKSFNLTTSFGVRDTYFTQVQEIFIKEKINYTIYLIVGGALVVLVLLVLFLRKRKQLALQKSATRISSRSRSSSTKNKPKKRSAPKKTSKKSAKKTTRKKSVSRKRR